MPTYDYECPSCGHTFEHFQSISSAPLKKCPKCAKNRVKRLLGAGSGILFKGSGFYQTDYRSASYQQAVGADKPAAATEKPAVAADKTAAAPAKASAGKSAATSKTASKSAKS